MSSLWCVALLLHTRVGIYGGVQMGTLKSTELIILALDKIKAALPVMDDVFIIANLHDAISLLEEALKEMEDSCSE